MSRPNRKARRAQFHAELATFPKNSVERTLRRQVEIMSRTNAHLLEKQSELVKMPARLLYKLDVARDALSYIASTSGDMNSASSAHVALNAMDDAT